MNQYTLTATYTNTTNYTNKHIVVHPYKANAKYGARNQGYTKDS